LRWMEIEHTAMGLHGLYDLPLPFREHRWLIRWLDMP